LKAGAIVLGAHELLKQYKDLNAFGLRVLNDNMGTTRLAGGTYAFKLQVLGATYIVLNPFHPYQLVPYTTPGHAIIVMEGLSAMSWKDLRNSICGVTDPTAAEKGSVRQLLLEKKGEYKLADVNKSTNGCHMSAGPLEAMVELKRFFDVKENELTNFGNLLTEQGVDKAKQILYATNPDITIDNKTISAFDATEELDADVSAKKLASSTK